MDSLAGEQDKIIRKANQDRGATVVMVTHDAKAATRGSRLVTMRDGIVVGDEPTRA